ncbi:UDP-N-acetylglucosamine 1-carboxyvinyltransferase [Halobacteriovorax sp. GB3]|uniref:UDP-N-acetylglucosamine 1-carboxyvinyltransferase n=1 Tax=Halobacteriovorax sp. GB3 TaxID=2719615 RepID=UPI002362D1A1|nr:UDP-N-acetylglucosamine 1-carboxyvinyltransferase [Halobacteriovorax sp. GB3]MDD0853910.1 UDP-N-acetylglucosamine 1-carboxyvinyltransferase [Halobacteriovorax sp. GB3]
MKTLIITTLLFAASATYASSDLTNEVRKRRNCYQMMKEHTHNLNALLIEKKLYNDGDTMAAFVDESLSLKGVGKKVVVKGPFKLTKDITINPAKNAILPIVTSLLVSDKPVHLYDLPKISDIDKLKSILSSLGVKISVEGNRTTFHAQKIKSNMAVCDMVKNMRASMLVLGPLMARTGAGRVALPGGCPIGSRPYDLHVEGLKAMGAFFDEGEDYLQAAKRVDFPEDVHLKGGKVKFHFPSVGATQNIMSAAVLAKGTTIIENAAREPEIDDLMNFLNAMGAQISWSAPGVLKIVGVKELKEVHYRPIGDRIEAGTYVMMALMTKSQIKIKGFNPNHMGGALEALKQMGAKMDIGEDYIEVFPSELKPINVKTLPHPGFPTDLQSPFMALLSTVEGESTIMETLFENRFMHVPYFNDMGTDIVRDGNLATINGSENAVFNSTSAKATDLRAAAALIMMASRSNGDVEIHDVKHLFRGYSDILEKLQDQGIDIELVDE